MKEPIYFDNASTTPLLPEVIEAMTDVMKNQYGNPSSIHSKGRKSKAIIEQCRKSIAQLLNCSVGEIFFTSSASESNNTILRSSIRHLNIERIITTKAEHPCVINTLQDIGNVEVHYLKLDNHGAIDIAELTSCLQSSTKKTLISLMYVNNELGNIHPIETIANLAKQYNALFHSDAVQAVGKLPIDLQQTPIHFISASAHKFHGPKGVGFMYIGGEYNIESIIKGGAQERNMRAGTENIYGIVGLTKALELAHQEMDQRMAHIQSLKQYFVQQLDHKLEDICINGSGTKVANHILSVSFPATDKVDLLMFNLDINGICCSAGSACSSGVEHDSPVLEAIAHNPKRKTIRFSLSHLNTLEEVNKVMDILCKLSPTKKQIVV